MDLDGAYEESNVFARILRGEIPKALVCEDADTLAFMDAFPQSPGHCLVISKRARARNILDVERPALEAIIDTVQRVARAVRAALNPDGITVTQFNGAAAGQTVYHLHFHVIPRYRARPLDRHATAMADPAELARLAEQIAARLGS